MGSAEGKIVKDSPCKRSERYGTIENLVTFVKKWHVWCILKLIQFKIHYGFNRRLGNVSAVTFSYFS